jgi:hypothetical protein
MHLTEVYIASLCCEYEYIPKKHEKNISSHMRDRDGQSQRRPGDVRWRTPFSDELTCDFGEIEGLVESRPPLRAERKTDNYAGK